MKLFGLLLLMSDFAYSFPFFALIMSIATGTSFLPSITEPVNCIFGECCFRENLTNRLYGQHIAIERLYYHVKAHMENSNPSRSLVLSFHGFTGIGKNYAKTILASSLFVRGEKSKFHHFFDATVDFLFKDSVELYKAKVVSTIRDNVRQCPRSMFVFDEVHKMPPGILDALVPFLGHTESIDGVDYRKAIFIFIGNSGGLYINSYVLETIKSGKNRLSIQYGDLRNNLVSSIYSNEGGLKLSDLIKKHVITAVIPFLPLQEVHVRSCIKYAAKRMGVEATEEMIVFVLSELDWEPEGTHLFSTSGCKLVYDKIGFYLQMKSDQIDFTDLKNIHGEL
ncbi:unnamed protein product [Hymenolepis diminuta]|uniref:Torsin-like protein n=1 Tax=Hymenolepis diminuta TaxID=6216 RepID=A0A0R3SUC5_HYMDI|nr:unnamed protein product [Hymenolepis diminuta]